MEEKLQPKLRFSEFEGDWDRKNIQDFATVFTGNKDTQNKIDGGLYPFFVRSNTIERINSWSFDGEAVLTAGDGVGVGKVFHYINGKFDFHQRVYAICNYNGVLGKFFYHVFSEKFYKKVIKLSAKNSVDSVRREFITKMEISIPSLPEQQKIANYLSNIDQKISLLQEKKAALSHYKKGMMQQLFSQQIRFKDENGNNFADWEEKRLGELTFKTDKKNKENIHYDVYSINNKIGFVPQADQFDDLDSIIRGFDISLYKIIDKNTFAYNPARVNVGSLGYYKNDKTIIVSSLYVCFKTNEGVNDDFFLHYLRSHFFNKSVLRNTEGGVRQYLFFENFARIKLTIPKYKEQQKIADFLSTLDESIATVNDQIKQTQGFKKAMLQQMFV